MVKLYGEANGFGWQLNEIVGAQIISVPMSVPIQHFHETFERFLIIITGVFITFLIVVNLLLKFIVTNPVNQMAIQTDDISTGNMELAEFDETGNNEITRLGISFNRMRRSLDKSMQMLGESGWNHDDGA